MAPARCSTLQETINQKVMLRLPLGLVTITPRFTTNLIIEVVTTHKSLKMLPNCKCTGVQTPWLAVTKATVSFGMVLAGAQRRTCTVTCTAQPIGTTSTNLNPSTSQSLRLLTVVLSGNSKSLTWSTNEEESETCYYMTV